MDDLLGLDKEQRVNTLVETMPGFLKWDMNVGEVFNLSLGESNAYFESLDMEWLMLVYRIHHAEVLFWCELPFAELIDPDYSQQAVNFVMAATLQWAQKFCMAYADSGGHDKLRETIGNCEVIYLDRPKIRLH